VAVLEEINYIQKAKIQYNAALCLFKHGYVNDAISRLYYSFRSLSIHVVGKPEKGKWRHSGLMKKLIMIMDKENKNFLTREERELIKDFPNIREEADYDLVEIPSEKFKIYLKIVDKFLNYVENLEPKND